MASHSAGSMSAEVSAGDIGPATVLHVDDDPEFVDLSKTMLEDIAPELSVTTETDPKQAMARVFDASPVTDCLLVDYDMPGLDGIELLDRLRSAGCDLPYVLYTGRGSEEVATEAIHAGVTDYLQKESGIDHYNVVANRLKEAIASHRTQTKLREQEQQYRQTLDSAPAPITMYDPHGSYVYANAAAAAFFGAESRDELLDHAKQDVLAPGDLPIEDRMGALAAGEHVPTVEHTYACLDGTTRTGLASCAPAVADGAAGVTVLRELSSE